jgi:hypothetical protein
MTKEDEWALEQSFNHVIANLDFNKIHKTMVKLDWRWSIFGIKDLVIPTENQMIGHIREGFYDVIHEIANEGYTSASVSGGGFTVIVDLNNYYVNVRFVIEEKYYSV